VAPGRRAGARGGDLQVVTTQAEKVLPDPTQPLNETYYGAITDRFAERARMHPERPAVYERDKYDARRQSCRQPALVAAHHSLCGTGPASCPRAVARVYSYWQVHTKSNKVANYLRQHGIDKGDVVAIFAHRSIAIIYAIMGVLKAGATFTVIGACACTAARPTTGGRR